MKFLAEDDQLTVTLEGWEMFFALKRKLVLKRESMADLEWQPEYKVLKRLWRIGGTELPNSLWAGRFQGGGKRYFLYVRRAPGFAWARNIPALQNILSITLASGRYQRILLTCDPDIGASLMNWWQGTSRPT